MKAKDEGKNVICPTSGIRWATEKDFLCVVDEKNGNVFRLAGFEAALWSCLTSGFDYTKVCRFTQAMLRVSLPEAESAINQVIQDWIASRMVESRAEGEHHG